MYYADPSGHYTQCQKEAYEKLLSDKRITEADFAKDPTLESKLWKEACDIVEERKRQQNNSSGNNIPPSQEADTRLALLDNPENRPKKPEVESPDNNSSRGNESGRTSIFRNGELYENFIEVDGHRIEALAEIDGDRLILRDIAIYSNEGDIPNRIGASAMKKWLDSVKNAARSQGFKQVQIIGQRAQHSTSANPGSIIDRIFDLE